MTTPLYKKIILKKDKERSVLNFHPWLFSGAIARQDEGITDGETVEVYSSENKYLATGHYNKGSIAVRLLLFDQRPVDGIFWELKLASALQLRRQLLLVDNNATNTYRLVHGEGDGLPGLIIDMYNDAAVIQCHSWGMYRAVPSITEALQKLYGSELKTIYNKSADTLHRQQQVKIENSFVTGNDHSTVVNENHIRFEVNWVTGQKTGFFIDQRDNRSLLMQYCRDKKVLNTFSYSGGFSLYALKAGAAVVDSVDSSKVAAELCTRNIELNRNEFTDEVSAVTTSGSRHHFFTADVFEYIKSMQEVYDVIILDPPAFAKHLDGVKKASIAYRNLNYEAFKRIAPGGILFTFSCSQAIDKILFRKIIFAAAAMSKRHIRILHQLTQPPDHPVSIYHPEGEYLKGLVLHVE